MDPLPRVAMLTPLPPARTGVAHYVSLLLPALEQRLNLRAFASLDGYARSDFDTVIYQLGNNPYHEVMYREAMREPGIAVLHDLVLHHLIVEMTLARGDADGYVTALGASHGAVGEAWARGRAAGLHTELGNFLLPGSVDVAQRSRAVIVHNDYAAERLRSFGVTVPIHVVAHPSIPETLDLDRDAIRTRFGFAADDRVIGFFGFLTSAKRAPSVLEAFRVARERVRNLRLLVVGEPAPDIDTRSLDLEGVATTGYVSDEEFPAFYAAADRCVNLRYPSAGETSGTLMRAFGAGKAVAVSDYAQFAEFPEECVFRVPLGEGEIERLVEFFTADLPSPAHAQRRWLETHASIDDVVGGYLAAISDSLRGETPVRSIDGTLPLFPRLELLDAAVAAGDIRIRIRNAGASTIRTRTYGQPEYRLIAKLFCGERQAQDRWLALPCDLRPGETAELTLSLVTASRPLELRLYHAIQDVPMLEPEPWTVVEVAGV